MTPKKIALLTDSSADLRWDQARENNIFFVPLRILCEDGEYLDGVNITGPDIYQRLHNGELPQTSLPRVEDFSAKLRETKRYCFPWPDRSSGRSLIWDMTA